MAQNDRINPHNNKEGLVAQPFLINDEKEWLKGHI